MNHSAMRIAAVCFIAASLAACQQTKSSSPLSPNVAGPMEGVTITMPLPVEPAAGKKVNDADQPLNVIIEEARTNGPRPVTMAFDIATDVGFSNIVFSRSGIAPSGEGLTHVRLSDRLQPGRSYYWRIKADDGANSTGWSNASHFEINQPIFIGPPEPLTPTGNVRVSSSTPELRVRNSQTTGPIGSLGYHFQISDNQTFNTLFAEAWVTQGNGETAYTTPGLPAPDKTFFWRSRASDGPNNGNWGRVESFRSPVAAPPPPPPPGGGGGGGGGGTGGSCASNNGDAIVACISAKYPERLRPVGSLGERQANMSFLRDRMIEAARCGGMDVGWNLKRGGPELSIDFIAWRSPSGLLGVDIGFDYDNIGTTLRLYWGAHHDPFAAYGGYTNSFSCN